jgi:hypothetical protein
MASSRSLPVLDLAGSRYELGYRHGTHFAEQIRAFLGDGLCRLNHLFYEPTSLRALMPTIKAYEDAIAAQLPGYIEEIRGLSDGAGIGYEEAILLQIRREVLGYRKVPSRGDCTTFARSGDGACVLAQTVDLNGNLQTESYLLRIAPGDRAGGGVMLLTFTGLLGYLGMNSHGLAVGLNLVMGGDWKPGIPAYMAIRHLLDSARNVAECVELLSRLRFASSRSFTVCDGTTAAMVEIFDNRLEWITSGELVRTNHFLDAEFSRFDAINVFARNASIRRLEACRAHLADTPWDAGVDEYFSILARPPICVHVDGDIRREATVAGVVMKPRSREMYVRGGYPCTGATQKLAF